MLLSRTLENREKSSANSFIVDTKLSETSFYKLGKKWTQDRTLWYTSFYSYPFRCLTI